jgi:hypothetical protein
MFDRFLTMRIGIFCQCLLGRYLKRTETQCYAWVLMDTHYHLVLRLSDRELWELMKRAPLVTAEYQDVGRTAVSAMCQ